MQGHTLSARPQPSSVLLLAFMLKNKEGSRVCQTPPQFVCVHVSVACVCACTTVRFAVWSHSPKSAPVVVRVAPGTVSCIYLCYKESCSHRESKQALASAPRLPESS